MSKRDESDALHERAQAMMRAFERAEPSPEAFDAVASDLARFQARHVPGYARLCASRGLMPGSIALASAAPAVPTDAFRLAPVFAFDTREAMATFRTSGTSLGESARGAHRMRRVDTYDAAALTFGRAMLARDLSTPVAVMVVGPPPWEAADSSLTHMCALFARELGAPQARDPVFFVRGGVLDVVGLRARVTSLSPAAPAIVLATSLALVHLLEAAGTGGLALPAGSRVMHTGGYKGRARALPPGELRREVAQAFAVDEAAVVGEYGMTELSSQFWEATLVDRDAPGGVYVEPPWARVVPVDPETLEPVAFGEVGIARIEDLANIDSAFAVLTEDRVRRVGPGFELLGRQAGAARRGCSIGVDEMLSARADP